MVMASPFVSFELQYHQSACKSRPMQVESINGKRYLRTNNDTEFINQTLRAYKDDVRITHHTLVARTPQQNGVVKRRNRMLVEAVRIMLIFSQSLLFLWAEAVATACYTQHRFLIHTRYNKTPYELLRDHKPNLKYLYIIGALCYPTNDSKDLGPELQPLTFGHISSGLILNEAASTSAKSPSKNYLNPLFQPMFDEYFKHSPSVVSTTISVATLLPPDIAGASSSTTIDQDAPSPSKTPTTKTTTTPLQSTNVEEPNNENAEFDSDTFTNLFALPLPSLAESSSRIIEAMQEEIHEFERLEVWELVPKPSRVMIINLKWIFKVNLDEYGGVLKQGVRHLHKPIQISLEMLKKYSLERSDAVDTPMVERSKLDEDPQGTPVDITRYRSMVGSLMYLTASRPNLVFVVCMCACTSGSAQFLREKLVSWSSKEQKCTAISTTEAKYISLSSCCAQILQMRSQLTDYGSDFNKIPLYCDSKSAIALSCNIVQHSRTKHIDVHYHFIKEQVENEVVELYFVKTTYQLVDIFTKALARERFKFLINRLGMQSITPEELKHLAKLDED
ncbi:retrovirus-related pol polyprotein from transposon TNT 1-94 [Tanacetum coccineum]